MPNIDVTITVSYDTTNETYSATYAPGQRTPGNVTVSANGEINVTNAPQASFEITWTLSGSYKFQSTGPVVMTPITQEQWDCPELSNNNQSVSIDDANTPQQFEYTLNCIDTSRNDAAFSLDPKIINR